MKHDVYNRIKTCGIGPMRSRNSSLKRLDGKRSNPSSTPTTISPLQDMIMLRVSRLVQHEFVYICYIAQEFGEPLFVEWWWWLQFMYVCGFSMHGLVRLKP